MGLLFVLDSLCLHRLLLYIRVLVFSLFVSFSVDYRKKGGLGLFGFLNSIVPSGAVSWYVKSCLVVVWLCFCLLFLRLSILRLFLRVGVSIFGCV